MIRPLITTKDYNLSKRSRRFRSLKDVIRYYFIVIITTYSVIKNFNVLAGVLNQLLENNLCLQPNIT